jgi:ABC-2 type transport system ATP-binding protein
MSKSLLTIQNVKKKYGSLYALKGVSFDLFKGEVVSLLGVNGAGKTTLSTLIGTLHRPTDGDILYEGRSIYDNLPAYRSIIGYCPQKANLNPLFSVRKNLQFAGEYYGMTAEEIEKRLKELNQRLGINRYLDATPDQLSGGWKQRVMLARTLIHSPRLVILDEPTVALDPEIRNQLWHYIEHIKAEGVCVLLTTHYLEEAERLSNRVVLLHEGEIKLVDTPQNLMTSFEKGRLEDVFIELTREKE